MVLTASWSLLWMSGFCARAHMVNASTFDVVSWPATLCKNIFTIGCSSRNANEHLHRCYNVLVNFINATVLAFVFTSIGLKHAGHEVLAVALVVYLAVVYLAVGNDILGDRSNRVGDHTLSFNGLEREGCDPGEQPQNEQGREGRLFITLLILSL